MLVSWTFWQKYWSGLLYPFSGDLPDSGIESASPVSHALAGGFFTTSSSWETPKLLKGIVIIILTCDLLFYIWPYRSTLHPSPVAPED